MTALCSLVDVGWFGFGLVSLVGLFVCLFVCSDKYVMCITSNKM